MVERRTPEGEIGFETYIVIRRVVSLSKTLCSPKSTGNTQEVVAPSGHD